MYMFPRVPKMAAALSVLVEIICVERIVNI